MPDQKRWENFGSQTGEAAQSTDMISDGKDGVPMEKLKTKWKEMNLYQRILLAVMLAEIFGFLIANVIVVNRPGLAYGDALLYPSTEGELQVYEGKLDGEPARFTVSPAGEISYQWGVGLEISQSGAVLFRGGYLSGGYFLLYGEDGEPVSDGISFAVTGGNPNIVVSVDGRELTQEELYEPSLSTLARIVLAPELTHRGNVWLYLAVTLLAVFNCFQICFPHFFFRLSLWSRGAFRLVHRYGEHRVGCAGHCLPGAVRHEPDRNYMIPPNREDFQTT